MESLKTKLTPEFLATLTEAARRYGHSGDYTEIKWFLEEVYHLAGQQPGNLEPIKAEHIEPWF